MSSYAEPIQPWGQGPDHPQWSETLRDGSKVLIRPITKEDAARERAFIEALSPRARRLRFLGQVVHPSDDLVARLTDIDYRYDVAFAAVAPDEPEERFTGVGRYSTANDGSSCECAVTVLDEWHNKGLGTVLMNHLIEVARVRGILFMYSIDASENTDMAELAKHLGFKRHIDRDDATLVVHSLWLSS